VQVQKISILPPQKGLEFPGGWGGSVRPKNLKQCVKLYWNFQRGGGVLEKIPSMGEVWIFSGTTQYGTELEKQSNAVTNMGVLTDFTGFASFQSSIFSLYPPPPSSLVPTL